MKHRVALALSVLGLAVLAGCGGSSTSNTGTNPQPLSQNWQLTMADQTDGQGNDFTGGLTGGFLLQKGNTVTGSFSYGIIPAPVQVNSVPCAGGSAQVSGTISGQTVTLTVTAGVQTFTLTGTVSADGSSMMGNYTTTGGVPLDGGGTCGVAQTGATWSAAAVPAITGSFQGNIHDGPVYAITGTLLQGANAGASSATVTGELFSEDDPCFTHAFLNGTISGSSVLLSVIGDSGLTIGEIGSGGGPGSAPAPAVFGAAGKGGGLILRGLSPGGFIPIRCPKNAGGGNICLGTGSATACRQPISFSMSSVVFPPLAVKMSRSQTLTLTNTDPKGATQSGTLTFGVVPSDFSPPAPAPPLYNFSEQDTCAPPPTNIGDAVPFTLAPNQSCTVTVTFSPVQSCTRNPLQTDADPSAVPPLQCPSVLPLAQLTVAVPTSADGNDTFSVDISGTGLSAIVPVEAQLGFGAVAQGQTGPPQTVTLQNTGAGPVRILPAIRGATCVPPFTGPRTHGVVPGLQVVTQGSFFLPDSYACDVDDISGLPSFPITSDQCTGVLLDPGKSCTLDIAFAPQPGIAGANDITSSAFDYFLQLSTLQCTRPEAPDSPCEIDSGRFPIDIKWNNQSPLRISPNTGFDFGVQTIGSDTVQSFTVFNDPTDPAFINASNPTGTTIEFLSLSTTSSSRFSQTNTCGSSLAPGSSCTISVIFHPTATSLAQDRLVIQPKNDLTEGIAQIIYLWGRGQ